MASVPSYFFNKMELLILGIMALAFVIFLLAGIANNSVVMTVTSLIFAVLIVGMIAYSGIDYVTGTNSTISDDGKTIINTDMNKQLPQLYTNAILTLFAIICLWLVINIFNRGG